MHCCPYYSQATGCTVAIAIRLCKDGSGHCAVNLDRCCGVVELANGARIALWESCRFYMHAADCRYCRHYDKTRNYCKRRRRKVRWYTGTCPDYDGPRPVPSLVAKR